MIQIVDERTRLIFRQDNQQITDLSVIGYCIMPSEATSHDS